jgi:nitroreductase
MTDEASRFQARYGAEVRPSGAWNETLDLLLAHRSVRVYLPDPLPQGALEAAIAAAQSASSSSNLQAWSVIAVEDEDRRQRLAALSDNRHVATAPLVLIWLADLARLQQLGSQEGEPGEGLDYFEGFLLAAVDAALAAQNAALALESLGLGCCYIGGMRNRPLEVAAELATPPLVFALFGMTVGRPDPARLPSVKPRLPQEAILFHEQYQWTETQRSAIALYNERLRLFQRTQKMREQDWSAQATARVRDAQALTGRHVLRDVLHKFGFKLK